VDENPINGNSKLSSCVKCEKPAAYFGIDQYAIYCQPCFHKAVKHKFQYVLGINKVFKNKEVQDVLLFYTGEAASRLLLSFTWQGVTENAVKRLRIRPTVMVYLSSTDKDELEKQVCECLEMSRKYPGSDEHPGWKWIFVHAAASLEMNEVLVDRWTAQREHDEVVGADKIDEYTTFLRSMKSESLRHEMQRLLQMHLVARLAKSLNCVKVLSGENLEGLANISMNALCFGRASSIVDLTSAMDRRIDGLLLVRPLRDICNKEVEIVNSFEGNSDSIFDCKFSTVLTNRGIQSVTANFLTSLQSNGYAATCTNVVSVSSKVQAATKGEIKCRLCFTLFVHRNGNSDSYCNACSNLLGELDFTNRDIILRCIGI